MFNEYKATYLVTESSVAEFTSIQELSVIRRHEISIYQDNGKTFSSFVFLLDVVTARADSAKKGVYQSFLRVHGLQNQ